MNKTFSKLLIIAVLLLSASIFVPTYAQNKNARTIEEYGPKLQIENVIQKARIFATKNDKKPEEYFISFVRYDATEKKWSLLFQGKRAFPGNHFGVTIEDRTETMHFSPGR